jgi:hypothetical protein
LPDYVRDQGLRKFNGVDAEDAKEKQQRAQRKAERGKSRNELFMAHPMGFTWPSFASFASLR